LIPENHTGNPEAGYLAGVRYRAQWKLDYVRRVWLALELRSKPPKIIVKIPLTANEMLLD